MHIASLVNNAGIVSIGPFLEITIRLTCIVNVFDLEPLRALCSLNISRKWAPQKILELCLWPKGPKKYSPGLNGAKIRKILG